MKNVEVDDVRGVLFDLDGVLYVDGQLIPGAIAALKALADQGIPYCFITNTTTQSAVQLQNKLVAMGIPCGRQQLISAPVATAQYLRREGLTRCFFAVESAVMGDFAGIEATEDNPHAVVLGDIGERWSYALLDRIFHCLLSGVRLVAMHRNKYWQTSAGLHIDIGAFVAGLEYVAETRAVITGKPSGAFFAAALAVLGVDKKHALLVGDDVISDIAGAQSAGIRGALVQTGKYREALVAKSGVTPDLLLPSVAELPARLVLGGGV